MTCVHFDRVGADVKAIKALPRKQEGETMAKFVRTTTTYMDQVGSWVYIVERRLRRGGRKTDNIWTRMPAIVDRTRPDKDNVDQLITASEVPLLVRRAAAAHFQIFDEQKP